MDSTFDRFACLRLPVIAAPLFIVSTPDMVIAQCRAGIVGSLPALNARTSAALDDWLTRIRQECATWDNANPASPAAPYAINLIAHRSNARLDADLALCVKHRVPIVITSLGARTELNYVVHSYGGIVFHDVVDDHFARKAISKGADGLIAVAAGAGGHAGTISPFAIMQEIRAWFDGPVALSGAIANGKAIAAAEMLGADFAYIGSTFIATNEANASADYKQMILAGTANDIIYTDAFTGVRGNYLRPSLLQAGIDPDNLPQRSGPLDFRESGSDAKVWRDIWAAGQGIGAVDSIGDVAEIIARLDAEYRAARLTMASPGGPRPRPYIAGECA